VNSPINPSIRVEAKECIAHHLRFDNEAMVGGFNNSGIEDLGENLVLITWNFLDEIYGRGNAIERGSTSDFSTVGNKNLSGAFVPAFGRVNG